MQGIDPREAERRRKEEARSAAEDTLQQIGNEWISVRGARWSQTYRHKIQTMLERHIFPASGKRPITQVSASQLLAILRPIEESGKTDLAHTLLQQVGAIFRYAISTGRAVNDPAAALRGALAPHREKNLPAITTPDEFAELLRAMDSYQVVPEKFISEPERGSLTAG